MVFHTQQGPHLFITQIQSFYEQWLLFTKGCLSVFSDCNSAQSGTVCLSTDDNAYDGSSAFVMLEADECKQSHSVNLLVLTKGKKVMFKGGMLQFEVNNHAIRQTNHIQEMSVLNQCSLAQDDFVLQRACGAYISTIYSFDASLALCFASQMATTDAKNIKSLQTILSSIKVYYTIALGLSPSRGNWMLFACLQMLARLKRIYQRRFVLYCWLWRTLKFLIFFTTKVWWRNALQREFWTLSYFTWVAALMWYLLCAWLWKRC